MVRPYSDSHRGYQAPVEGVTPEDNRDGRIDTRYDYPRNRDEQHGYRDLDREDHGRRSSRSPHSRRGRQPYRDRDDEGYRSPPYSGSGSPSRGGGHRGYGYMGQESREVLIEGFPIDMTEDDVMQELRNAYHVNELDDLRIIRDRVTRVSKQLGFLRFRSLEESREFVERNHPSIYLYGPTAQRSTKVRIAYCREKEDRTRPRDEPDWPCQNCGVSNYSTRQKCFRCHTYRPEEPPAGPFGMPPQKVVNSGDNDVALDSQPSQFLLIRGLDGSVSEELLARGVAKLYRPAAESQEAGSVTSKKGGKAASATGDANLGAREGSIRRVLLVRDRRLNESWRYGFAEFADITDAQAALARFNSFERFTISSRPVMISYIHAGVFVPVMDFEPTSDKFTFSPLINPAMKLRYWDVGGYVTELEVSPAKDDDQGNTTTTETPVTKQEKAPKEKEKPKKRKAEATGSSNPKRLAMPSALKFWSDRHAELHGTKEGETQPADQLQEKSAPVQSYADLNRNCCYLCLRQFESPAKVNRHERLSQMHRENLNNPELVKRGIFKLVKHGIITPPQNSTESEYRDRAKERRQTYGQVGTSDPRPGYESEPEEAEEPPSNVPSKGAALLSKMGWSEGSGLGAQGTGVTAPIATEVYAQGVGLGAQGGKLGDAVEEAGRNTRGRYDEFLEKTKENARQRYDKMS
ncbi:hypothetical protein N7470_005299 [Penicillium chermesinum]|nr:hypothetical protein N7470_005299 [Penicillium chermesinum]